MSARRHIPPTLEGHAIQAPGMMRHGPFPAGHRTLEPLSRSDLLEHKIAAQAADIEQLAGDNNRLATSHMAMREDLAAAQQEEQRLKAHIRSIQTESDIQIRLLLDKIAKMEKDIRAGEKREKGPQTGTCGGAELGQRKTRACQTNPTGFARVAENPH
ncbi:PROTEIN FLX-LIKE 2 [Salix purpurea]|uniref:PROTEIN FLX-LIKE 2 n=1 Tax=Salix purpurea TaxID=77065 RepID=A0A9Q0Q2A3_SALPP|nr:PROTEIN FLX-LIKE 2 [Salix purpurea]